jgi:hypothetical protein
LELDRKVDDLCISSPALTFVRNVIRFQPIFTLRTIFPQYIILKVPYYPGICGVVFLQRKSDLPEEESGPQTLKRTGNGTHARQLERWK